MKKIIFIFLLIPTFIYSQELNARVSINYEKLSPASKERLVEFGKQVETYLNQNKYTGQNWEGDKINCSFTIFFLSASDELHYTAQVVVTSQRPIYNSHRNSLMLSVLDTKWSFRYEKNQILYFDPSNFDPLTSLLDFYSYLIIGYDSDSYDPLGGSDLYAKAYDLAVLGGNSSSSSGWVLNNSSYSRRAFIEDIRNSQFRQFREDFFDYHYNGLDEFYKNKAAAQKNMVKIINNLYSVIDKINRRSVVLKVFFDAKHAEFYEYLKDYPDKYIFKKLKKIDPSHISTYDKVLYTE